MLILINDLKIAQHMYMDIFMTLYKIIITKLKGYSQILQNCFILLFIYQGCKFSGNFLNSGNFTENISGNLFALEYKRIGKVLFSKKFLLF